MLFIYLGVYWKEKETLKFDAVAKHQRQSANCKYDQHSAYNVYSNPSITPSQQFSAHLTTTNKASGGSNKKLEQSNTVPEQGSGEENDCTGKVKEEQAIVPNKTDSEARENNDNRASISKIKQKLRESLPWRTRKEANDMRRKLKRTRQVFNQAFLYGTHVLVFGFIVALGVQTSRG